MTTITGPPDSAIRNLPITQALRDLLAAAAAAAGVDTIRIVSGGQPARNEGTRRTGSTRHDHGRAADIQLVVNGRTQVFSDRAAGPVVIAFITAAAAHGATGIGAGVEYMGDKTIHVGFGTSVNDHTKLTWGAGGRSAKAPQWLRDAAQAGWDTPLSAIATAPDHVRSPGRYAVIARDGLKLRGGPGTQFEPERTLPLGTELNVLSSDPAERSWARVDLEGDGLLDGYVFAAFLAPVAGAQSSESAVEPD
ncbi:MAG: hypothetical protein QOG66_2405 [Methylobacteriaceae bacterium]|jgi:hypothetical protein|nr:hypothetical protein [Methylobacteriaceae bacterium]